MPVERNISLLRKEVNAFDEAIRIWRQNDSERMAPGYQAIVEQAGIEHTREYKLIEQGQPWEADAFRRTFACQIHRHPAFLRR